MKTEFEIAVDAERTKMKQMELELELQHKNALNRQKEAKADMLDLCDALMQAMGKYAGALATVYTNWSEPYRIYQLQGHWLYVKVTSCGYWSVTSPQDDYGVGIEFKDLIQKLAVAYVDDV